MSRFFSLLLAGIITLTLVLYPRLLGGSIGPFEHSVLPFILLGVSGGFVHGVGFRPDARWIRIILGPFVAWSLMIGGSLLLFLRY